MSASLPLTVALFDSSASLSQSTQQPVLKSADQIAICQILQKQDVPVVSIEVLRMIVIVITGFAR
jgi:hypothetical protein